MTTSETTPRETSPFRQMLKVFIRGFQNEEDEGGEDAEETPSVDETLDVLKHDRRRSVIDQLAETDRRRVSVANLAEAVACAEYGCEPSDLEEDQHKRVYIALQQSHLPRLDEADVVTYVSETSITKGPQFEHIRRAQLALIDAL